MTTDAWRIQGRRQALVASLPVKRNKVKEEFVLPYAVSQT